MPLMPWQRLVAEVGGEVDDDGVPVYREVVVTVPRQNGKTTLVLSWECQRAIGWEHIGPQKIAYSAQTGNDARKKFIEDQVPILERHSKALGIKPTGIKRGMGNEAVEWSNGSRLGLLNSTEDSGHGRTIDLAVKDEFFADYDDRRDQTLVPAMATRKFAQILTCSTMGTEESVPLNALVDRGRAAVEAGKTYGTAYFEWSADEGLDPDDPATWWSCMPALGFTITEAVIQHARATLKDGEFRRAFLNQRTKSDEWVIARTLWEACCYDDLELVGALTFSLDVEEDSSAAAIAASDSSGAVELVEQRDGTSWLTARAVELSAKWGSPAWAVDASGPAAPLIPRLEHAGLRVVALGPGEVVNACGALNTDVLEGSARIRRDARLNESLSGAAKAQVGDRWRWTRKNSKTGVSPLVAVTLARAVPPVDLSTQVW